MASLTITFKSFISEEDILIELDEEKNNGKTEFLYGEKAYFKVYAPDINYQIVSSDGTITSEGIGQETVEETLEFVEGREQTTSKPIVAINSYSWLGNSLGNISKKDIKTIQAEKEPDAIGPNGIGLLRLQYSTQFIRYSITVPQKQEAEYEVLVVVVGG